MKLLFLLISLLLLTDLLTIYLFLPTKQISSSQELSELVDNTKVSTSGKIISVFNVSNFYVITLNSNIQVTYDSKSPLQLSKNQYLEVQGKVSTYQNEKQITASEIKLD